MEFKDQVTADILRAFSEGMPPFYAQLKADTEARLAQPGGLAAVELEMAHRLDQQVYRLMSAWMQRTAALAPKICPVCDQPLEQVKQDLEREMVLKTGSVKQGVLWDGALVVKNGAVRPTPPLARLKSAAVRKLALGCRRDVAFSVEGCVKLRT